LENLAEALQQNQIPAPLLSLDAYLTSIRSRIEKLHTARIEEFATLQDKMTSLRQTVYEQTPIATELDRIANEVSGIHSSVVRIQDSKMVLKAELVSK
jgi:DNA integrity scanning protein DisA with diadenylate cyclase activity